MINSCYVGTYPKDKYTERRKNISKCFTRNILETQEFSLTKDYLCSIDLVETIKPGIQYTIVNLFNAKHELLIKLERNAFECWICLIDDHPVDKKDYFIVGEDHQGYSVYNLTDNIGYTYLPEEVSKGNSFVWHEVIPSPSGMSLAVIGSYLQSDLQLAFYDFSNPNSLPLPEVNRHYFIEFDEVEGWQGEEVFSLKRYRYFRKSDKKSFDDLPESECDYLLSSPALHERIVQIDKYSKSVKENVVE